MQATLTTEPGTAAGRPWGKRLRALAAGARAIVGDALGAVRHRVELLRRHPGTTADRAEDRARVTAAAAPRTHTLTRRGARVLSGVVAGLMAAASAAGLWWAGLYRDPAPVVALLRGYDLVALLVAVPVLVGALVRACRGSARAELLAACALAYAVYHYAIYVFGTAFNALFLAHLALLGLAAVALVLTLRNLDVRGLDARLHPRRASSSCRCRRCTWATPWTCCCWCPATPPHRCCCGGAPPGATCWPPCCSAPGSAASSTT